MAGEDRDVVAPLHRAPSTPGVRADLRALSAEQSATVLVDEFARTGYAEGAVAGPQVVRQLVRRDCRRRALPVKTLSAGTIVAVIDEGRHEQWLGTTEGREYARQRDEALGAALAAALPKIPNLPRRHPLRPVD